jgi:hypothetical protein
LDAGSSLSRQKNGKCWFPSAAWKPPISIFSETGELKMMFNNKMKTDPGIFREFASTSEKQEAAT